MRLTPLIALQIAVLTIQAGRTLPAAETLVMTADGEPVDAALSFLGGESKSPAVNAGEVVTLRLLDEAGKPVSIT